MGITRDRDYGPDIVWTKQEVLYDEVIGSCQVTRERLTRPDSSLITVTTAVANNDSAYSLFLDPRLLNGIITEPGGLLIDQKKTQEYWNSPTPAGIKPEDFLTHYKLPENSVAVPPSNAFWQLGGFVVIDNQIYSLPEDATLNDSFEMMTLTGDGWGSHKVSLVDGKPSQPLSDIRIGLCMPLVLKDGRSVPQTDILARADLRALADLRNFVDFSSGREVDNRFWGLLRKFLPTDASSAKQIAIDGGEASIETDISPDEALQFKSIIEEAGLQNHWQVIPGVDGKPTSATIRGIFPPNRLPLVGIGNTYNGNLMITVGDGRQPSSTGLTIDELGSVMAKKGAVNAGLGSAGGDAVLITKDKKDFRLLSSPSTTIGDQRVTRPVPSILAVS